MRRRAELLLALLLLACGSSEDAFDSPITGGMQVAIVGLPDSAAAAVTVTGPGGYSHGLTAAGNLDDLVTGTYTVAAAAVVVRGTTYDPGLASQSVLVTAGGTRPAATVAYGSGPTAAPFDLFIDGMYVVQSVQSYGDTVPLVAGRDAVVRVFVRATAPNNAAPAVRLRIYLGTSSTPAQIWTVAAARGAVPTTIREDSLAWSWNQLVPGTLLQPGARLIADVDPANAVAEGDEANNTFPASGTAKSLDVRTVSPFTVRFVSIRTAGNNATGNVSSANRAQFLATFGKLYPVATIGSDVRAAVYTTTTSDTLQSNNGNGAWGAVLSEISALRVADGFMGHYYGVARAGYGSGIAGLGYVPGRTAVGWDRLPSGDGVAAHELGHNLSLEHAPCGGARDSDPGFPHVGGLSGIYGLDVAAMVLKLPSLTDLMGYCDNTWISDYHYLKAMNHRRVNAVALVMSARSEPGLLVWGRIVDGVVMLEPAFEVMAPARLPSGHGAFALEALDAAGRATYAAAFDGEVVADQAQDERHFAFVVPLTRVGTLARLQIRGGIATSVRTSRAAIAAGVQATPLAVQRRQAATMAAASREGGERVRLRWDAGAYPMALVRDAATGDILSFARGGDAALVGEATALDITFSDGVRSRKERATVR